ncbi:twin-arginine translocase TatA/TatE family subunit [bacterium]|nr:twin-arginine translocase TatA/TatE family subunit [bacterium]
MLALLIPYPLELLVIFLVLLVVFGSSRIPALMRALGSSINEFKKGMHESGTPPAPPTAERVVPTPVAAPPEAPDTAKAPPDQNQVR